MKDKIHTLFKENPSFKVDESRKIATIKAAQNELLQQKGRYRQSYYKVILNQFPYISKKSWFAYIGLFLLMLYLISVVDTFRINSILSIFLSASLLICIPEIMKSYSGNMQEIESVCLYDLKTVVAARLILLGSSSLFISAILLSVLCFVQQTQLISYVLYGLVPFNIHAILSFIIIRKCKKEYVNTMNMMLSLLLILCYSRVPQLFPVLYETSSILFWLITAFITCVILANEIWKLLKNISYIMEEAI